MLFYLSHNEKFLRRFIIFILLYSQCKIFDQKIVYLMQEVS